MPSHPPLCPKTPDYFVDGPLLGVFIPGLVDEETPRGRRLIARYQACAWQDRFDRWIKVWKHNRIPHYTVFREFEQMRKAEECAKNARAWREWETP